jgi:hypothetical protein
MKEICILCVYTVCKEGKIKKDPKQIGCVAAEQIHTPHSTKDLGGYTLCFYRVSDATGNCHPMKQTQFCPG